MPFEEEKLLDKLQADIKRRQQEVAGSRVLIENLVTQEVHAILLQELERAIAMSPEFQHPLLRDRLFNYFDDPENIIVNGKKVLVHPDADSQSAKSRWLQAKEAANVARGTKGTRTKKQAATYWKYRVYDGDRYESTISERLSLLDANDAPYWAFLEHGTGIGAWPVFEGTHFLTKARRRAEFAYTPIEREVLRKLHETPIEQPIRYSRTWVTSTGRMWSFEFAAGEAKRVVRIG